MYDFTICHLFTQAHMVKNQLKKAIAAQGSKLCDGLDISLGKFFGAPILMIW